MTDAYYGFFWTGGVCPEETISALQGNHTTDDSVVAGILGLAVQGSTNVLIFAIGGAGNDAGYSLASD
jgi:hypothetical protein